MFIAGLLAGTGILSLPKAVDNIGWTGLILIVFYAILSTYTSIQLGEAWNMAADLYDDCRGHVQNPYELLAQKTYGNSIRYLVSVCLYISMFGSTIVMILVIADNLEILVRDLGYDVSKCFWLLIIVGCLTPVSWLGTPKDFWWMAYGAVAATVLCVVAIVISCSLDAPNHPIVRHPGPDLKKISLGIGIIAYIDGVQPYCLTFLMDMRKPKQFKVAAVIGSIIVLILLLSSAIPGYLVYGEDLEDNILNNLPYGVFYYIVFIFITLHLLLATTTSINPILQAVELVFHVPKVFTWKRCVSRSCVFFGMLFVAETIPKFSSLQSLLGGSTYTLLGTIFPVLFYTKMCKITAAAGAQVDNYSSHFTMETSSLSTHKTVIPLWRRVLHYEIIGIGVLFGVATSVSAIIIIVSPNSFSMPCYINLGDT
ncbi:uncharacterized protein [Argopecten irradians]|uniref:uncharacterized protein n=1 Tax=Argopecten irradians TaxID=31199 RepID=UPI00372423D1